jgi:hypothetical protein
VVNHAGSLAVRLLAGRSGLTERLSQVLNQKDALVVHDRGRGLAETAVMIADGGRVMSDPTLLRDRGELFGPGAADPTLEAGSGRSRSSKPVTAPRPRVESCIGNGRAPA